MKQVELLLPTHNVPKKLEALLCSVKAQTYKNFVLRIGDNSEKDKVIEKLIRSFRTDFQIQHIQHDKNIGAFRNHNFLLGTVDADYFCLINSDDLLNESFVEAHLQNLERNSCAVSASTLKRYMDGKFIKVDHKPITNSAIESFFYCLSKYKTFASLESIYYGMVRNPKKLTFSITDRLGTANGLVFKYALLGAIQTADDAIYIKHGSHRDFERYRQLRRIPALTNFSKIFRLPEIIPYFFLNSAQALYWRVPKSGSSGSRILGQ